LAAPLLGVWAILVSLKRGGQWLQNQNLERKKNERKKRRKSQKEEVKKEEETKKGEFFQACAEGIQTKRIGDGQGELESNGARFK